MRNILVAILFLFLIVVSLRQEPVTDTIDSFAGATNETYGPAPDSVAGASYEHEDEDDDEWDD